MLYSCFPQLRSFGLGLGHFQLRMKLAERGDPYNWPLLSLTPDRATTGICAIHWLQRVKYMNIDEVYDMNRSAWDDEKLAVSQVGDKAWLLLMLLTVNVMSGPWSSDARYAQSCQALQRMWGRAQPHRVPIFMAKLGFIAEEMKEPSSQEDLAEVCWNRFSLMVPFDPKATSAI